MIKGSGRSIPGFNLFTFFQEGFPELISFGGHAQAVGFTIKESDFLSFRGKCQKKMESVDLTCEPLPQQAIAVETAWLTIANVKDLDRLEPLPKEIQMPLFAIEKPTILRTFHSSKVMKYTIQTESGTMDAVLFAYKGLRIPDTFHTLIGRLLINRWQGKESVQMEIDGFMD